MRESYSRTKLDRRRFLKLGGGLAVAAMAGGNARATTSYLVGIGHDTDPYNATVRAVQASGGWPPLNLSGKTVVIKPNLVAPQPAQTGTTTDPQVVRALVDMALAGGVQSVLIVEASPRGANFSQCGYSFFSTYDPRVQLIDLGTLPSVLVPVNGGLAYTAIYTEQILLGNDLVFISAGKLKTHVEAMVTLSMKNLFGIPAVTQYISSPPAGRFAMHDRGVNETIIDLNHLRPINFAVIDGIWGMEGSGPLAGNPVEMDTVFAGLNPVAVDRVAVSAMQISQQAVQHLTYASRFKLGPSSLSQISIVGDPLVSKPFVMPTIPPVIEYPRVVPASISLSLGQTAAIYLWYNQKCNRTVEIVRLFDTSTQVDTIRTLIPCGIRQSGTEQTSWNGLDNNGSPVPPGRYAAHVRAYSLVANVRHADAVTWVNVSP